jgi:hypothetical protein
VPVLCIVNAGQAIQVNMVIMVENTFRLKNPPTLTRPATKDKNAASCKLCRYRLAATLVRKHKHAINRMICGFIN